MRIIIYYIWPWGPLADDSMNQMTQNDTGFEIHTLGSGALHSTMSTPWAKRLPTILNLYQWTGKKHSDLYTGRVKNEVE